MVKNYLVIEFYLANKIYVVIDHYLVIKTSQELRMLSTVTLDCQVTQIVMKSGSQLKEL